MRIPSLAIALAVAAASAACGEEAARGPAPTATPRIVGTYVLDRAATRDRFRAKALADVEANAAGKTPEDLAKARAFVAALDPTRDGDEKGLLEVRADGTARYEETVGPSVVEGRWALEGTRLTIAPVKGGASPLVGTYEGDEVRFPSRSTEAPYEAVLRRK